MLFNSYIFILLFLPAALSGYFLLNRKGKNKLAKAFLALMSLWFYGYFNINYLWIICCSILCNYIIMKRIKIGGGAAAGCLAAGITGNLGILFLFKYYDFFIININAVFHTDFGLKHLILPLGISFFTFQQISLLLDTYKGETKGYCFLDYSIYVLFFPQLIAGPIVLHNEVIPQFRDPEKQKLNYDNLARGFAAFSMGLAKKVLIADLLGRMVSWGFENSSLLDTTNIVIIMLAYTFQIYFDFSGYGDMAIGIAKMFNIELPVNFDSPYKADTVPEFWKRWHITLTRFFTKYLYIPLGGSRRGKARTWLNILIVFFASGFWHGANWTFILWGLCHGIANILTRMNKKRIEAWHPAFRWISTFLFINVTWLIFRSESLAQGGALMKGLLSLKLGPIRQEITGVLTTADSVECLVINHIMGLLGANTGWLPVLFVAGCAWIVLNCRNVKAMMDSFQPSRRNLALYGALFFWVIISMMQPSVFLYFNF